MMQQPVPGGGKPSHVTPFQSPVVLGAGAWGTALAATLAEDGSDVRIWGRDATVLDDINRNNENSRFLGDAKLPPSLRGVAGLETALDGADVVLIVVPSRGIRAVARAAARFLDRDVPIAVCAKGIEPDTGFLMTQIVEEEIDGAPVGCVSGPTFARETVLKHPTAATVAFPFRPHDRLNPEQSPAARLAVSLSTGHFRAYISDDLVGVEIGGAVKNVIAIACGMMMGAGLGDNTRAAIITRGLNEMKGLSTALGGRRETLTGLSGLGDLTLTCSSPTSRNMSLGMQLGSGVARADCFDGRPVVVEGEANAISITDLARTLGVAMPICETVRAVLHDGADMRQAFAALWARPIQAEPLAMDVSFAHPANPTQDAETAERIS